MKELILWSLRLYGIISIFFICLKQLEGNLSIFLVWFGFFFLFVSCFKICFSFKVKKQKNIFSCFLLRNNCAFRVIFFFNFIAHLKFK